MTHSYTILAAKRPYDFSKRYPRRRRGKKSWNPLTWTPNPISIPRSLPPLTAQRSIVYLNILFFIYQLLTAIQFLPQLNSLLIRSGYTGPLPTPTDITKRNLTGAPAITVSGRATLPKLRMMDPRVYKHYYTPTIVASSMGPLTADFIHQQTLSVTQPHRYLTAGFLHGSLLHLLLNSVALWNLPRWVEVASHRVLYVTTYLVSIVTGNLFHSHLNGNVPCLGASAGICGVNGLMFILLRKMKRFKASRSVFKNMILLVLLGMSDKKISNAGHIGGFLGGIAMGYLFGPEYRKSYAMKKTWFIDDSEREVRRVMGPDLAEGKGLLRIEWLWVAAVFGMLWRREFLVLPLAIGRGLWNPGVLSGTALR